MSNFWDDLTKWLDETSKVVGKEAGDLTLKGKLKIEIFELSRSLKDAFMELERMSLNSPTKKGIRTGKRTEKSN